MYTTKPKNKFERQTMKTGGKTIAQILHYLKERTVAGITTWDVDQLAKEQLKKHKVGDAFLGYGGFPGSICVSINDEVIHGAPKKTKVIQKYDLVSLDFGIIYQGLILDSAITFCIESYRNEQSQLLVERTHQSLLTGIAQIRDGATVGDYGYEVESFIKNFGYGIVRDYAGHGIGKNLHESPLVPNYGQKEEGFVFREGMTFALEPMVTLGQEETETDVDGFTVITTDGSLSAHFEHTILVGKHGAEILTII